MGSSIVHCPIEDFHASRTSERSSRSSLMHLADRKRGWGWNTKREEYKSAKIANTSICASPRCLKCRQIVVCVVPMREDGFTAWDIFRISSRFCDSELGAEFYFAEKPTSCRTCGTREVRRIEFSLKSCRESGCLKWAPRYLFPGSVLFIFIFTVFIPSWEDR